MTERGLWKEDELVNDLLPHCLNIKYMYMTLLLFIWIDRNTTHNNSVCLWITCQYFRDIWMSGPVFTKKIWWKATNGWLTIIFFWGGERYATVTVIGMCSSCTSAYQRTWGTRHKHMSSSPLGFDGVWIKLQSDPSAMNENYLSVRSENLKHVWGRGLNNSKS